MLDMDLAEIYGYETKRFNEQVKNNSKRFDEDFRFRLTKQEVEICSRSKISTSSWGGARYLPYAFKEQGVYMLMTVLKGDLAVRQRKNGYLVYNGHPFRSDYIFAEIYRHAKKTILLVDNYISIKTLQLLLHSYKGVKITVYSDNLSKELTKVVYDDFKKEYPQIDIKIHKSGGIFHDRYIVLDYGPERERIFLCGTSSKDGGRRISSILEDRDREKYHPMIDGIKGNPILKLKLSK